MDLSDGAKLTYLCSSLTGDALGVIASLSTTNANYEVAVQKLKERFDPPFAAVKKVALDLLNITTSGWTTRELSDHMNRNIDPARPSSRWQNC
ncbi:hypothetical protein T11_13622 [Trichinella zimbabwensis]|uniref:Uncharacterized protein n=1 Tax=Trichinella zimbabwensis TaxID=268475 RepID=A0A0V1HM18_9BILA|nr:hypothetical protein T11_13622 [Trichinella zimbabwensis]